MNFRLDVAGSDITGMSIMTIIQVILGKELRGKFLASLCNKRVKKLKEIADGLQGHFNYSLMYELKDRNDMYHF
jgi:hypothetical protein